LKYKSKNPYVGNIRVQRWRAGDIEILGLHRETGQRQQVTVNLPEEKHIYDLRDRMYIGKTGRWMNQIIPSRARFFALLPQRCPAPRLEHPPKVKRGALFELKVSIPGAAGPHALRVEAKDALGRAVESWRRVQAIAPGTAKMTFPVAWNDPPGKWSVTIADVFTPDEQVGLSLLVE